MRSVECEKLLKYFTDKNENYFLIGSCVVTEIVEQYVIDEINKHNEPILLYGCISKKITDAVRNRNNIKIIRINDLEKILNNGSIDYSEINNTSLCYTIKTASLSNRDYKLVTKIHQNSFYRLFTKPNPFPFLIIAQGCTSKCSFCHSKFYIGKVKSKTIDIIADEYRNFLKKKYKFIDIIAENTGAYGIDINKSLPELLEALDGITPDNKVKWMIDGLDPIWLIKYKDRLAPLIAKKRITVINLPVQSGNVRVLKLMNRYPDREKTIETLKEYRKLNPKLHLQGVFIVGFPSETDDDFNDTLSLINEIRFDDVTFIQYSEFDICESSKIKDKVPENVINNRINIGREYLIKIGIKEIR